MKISSGEINHPMERYPNFKRGPIDFEKYSEKNIRNNFVAFIKDELLFERFKVAE